MRGILLATTLVVLAQLAGAAPPKAGITVLKAARMFDARTGRVVSPALVTVEGDTIRAVASRGEPAQGAPVIDLGDATLLPGFMDAHTHMSWESSEDWKQDQLDRLKKPVAEMALIASEHARKTLYGGFTTVRDLGSADLIDVGLRNAIASGKIVGPRMLVSVYTIGATGGHCDPVAGYRTDLVRSQPGVTDGVADGPDAIRAVVRRNLRAGADVIKVCATGGVLSLTDDVDTPQLTQAELDALVSEAHALRRRAAAHAHGAEGAKRAIRAGIDSIEHGTFLDDEALSLMKAKGTYLVPTLSALACINEKLGRALYLPPPIVAKARAAAERLRDNFKRALGKGVKIALGTDAAVCAHGRNVEELVHMVDLGMRPAEALKAATLSAAALLGLDGKLGVLEAGKLADVIAVPGDPTRDIHVAEKVFFVMKEGHVYRHDRGEPPVKSAVATPVAGAPAP